jgi:glycosyltransferase involved in cell wall biosynthesis
MQSSSKKKILFLSHDASRTGAPMVLLHLLRWLKLNTSIDITIMLLDEGNMVDDFKAVAPVHVWNTNQLSTNLISKLFNKVYYKIFKKNRFKKFPKPLRDKKFDLVYLNTVVSTSVIPKLKELYNCPILLHVHENEFTIKNFYPNSLNEIYIKNIDCYIAVSESTKTNLVDNYKINSTKIEIINEFVPIVDFEPLTKSLENIKRELLVTDEFIVGGSGLTSWRKGVDLFLQVAAQTIAVPSSKKYKFVWIGEVDKFFQCQFNYEIKRLGLTESNIIFTGRVSDPQNYFQLFDLFFLSSREDPFPLVCLEAAALEKPIICFENAGGMSEFINETNGEKIKYGDVEAVTKKIIELSNDKPLLLAKGQQIKKDALKFDLNIQAAKIYDIIAQN